MKEGEVQKELREFIINMKKEEEPIEISRAGFTTRCLGAIDVLSEKREQADHAIQSIVHMHQRSVMAENDPDMRVTYLEMPDGMPAAAIEPKGRFGFKTPEDERNR